MSGQQRAGRRPPFPFRRLARDAVVVGVICVACAVIITVISGRAQYFLENLVFSLLIGGIAFLITDVSRLLLWGENGRPGKLPFIGIVLVAVTVGQFGGTMLGALLFGMEVPPLRKLIVGGSNGMLLFTLIMTIAAGAYVHSRELLLHAKTAAAEEKARGEAVARQALQAQLQLLQAQIEPHMLFNTLANVQGMIAIDPVGAERMLDQLIQYLRASLASSRAQVTTLGQEFALMDAYLGLMSVRMGTRLGYTLQLPDALRATPVPPMLLQPLVENAIIHGLEPKVDGGHITVSASMDGDTLALCVADTGLGLDAPPAKSGTHVGVANTRDRLLALFGAQAALTLEPNQPQGAIARLAFPVSPP